MNTAEKIEKIDAMDCETLFGQIEFEAEHNDALAKAVLTRAKAKGWSVQRTALILAYALLQRDQALR
jgi:hypothetical protein